MIKQTLDHFLNNSLFDMAKTHTAYPRLFEPRLSERYCARFFPQRVHLLIFLFLTSLYTHRDFSLALGILC